MISSKISQLFGKKPAKKLFWTIRTYIYLLMLLYSKGLGLEIVRPETENKNQEDLICPHSQLQRDM